jgi:hypothetical protein
MLKTLLRSDRANNAAVEALVVFNPVNFQARVRNNGSSIFLEIWIKMWGLLPAFQCLFQLVKRVKIGEEKFIFRGDSMFSGR